MDASITKLGSFEGAKAGKLGDGKFKFEKKVDGKKLDGDDASHHSPGKPDPAYVASAKAKLSVGLHDGQEVGKAKDGMYKGKSTQPLKGGRFEAMKDRMTMDLVSQGHKLPDAQQEATKQALDHGKQVYGAQAMTKAHEGDSLGAVQAAKAHNPDLKIDEPKEAK